MGFFGASMLGSCGLGLYAVAALVWDRRHELADQAGARDPRRRSIPTMLVLGSLLVGSILVIFGVAAVVSACADLISP